MNESLLQKSCFHHGYPLIESSPHSELSGLGASLFQDIP